MTFRRSESFDWIVQVDGQTISLETSQAPSAILVCGSGRKTKFMSGLSELMGL